MNTELDDLLALVESSAPKEFLDEFHRSEAEREADDDDDDDAPMTIERLHALQQRSARVDAALRTELAATSELEHIPTARRRPRLAAPAHRHIGGIRRPLRAARRARSCARGSRRRRRRAAARRAAGPRAGQGARGGGRAPPCQQRASRRGRSKQPEDETAAAAAELAVARGAEGEPAEGAAVPSAEDQQLLVAMPRARNARDSAAGPRQRPPSSGQPRRLAPRPRLSAARAAAVRRGWSRRVRPRRRVVFIERRLWAPRAGTSDRRMQRTAMRPSKSRRSRRAGRARRDVRAQVFERPHAPRAAAAADALVRKEGRKDAARDDRARDFARDRGLDDGVRRLVGVHADDRARALEQRRAARRALELLAEERALRRRPARVLAAQPARERRDERARPRLRRRARVGVGAVAVAAVAAAAAVAVGGAAVEPEQPAARSRRNASARPLLRRQLGRRGSTHTCGSRGGTELERHARTLPPPAASMTRGGPSRARAAAPPPRAPRQARVARLVPPVAPSAVRR